jgi:hypothetical protein
MSFGWTAPVQQAETRQRIAESYATVYDGVATTMPGTGSLTVLEIYQETFRVLGIVLLAALLLSPAGIVLGRGRARLVTLLLLGVALYIYLVSAALNSYEVRYGMTPSALLLGAAALGAWTLRLRRHAGAAP